MPDAITVLPVHVCSSSIPTNQDIEIRDENGNILAILCVLEGQTKEISSLTEDQLHAYRHDNQNGSKVDPYTFERSYIVLKTSDLETYKLYKIGSSIWGGFTHMDDGDIPERKTNSNNGICARKIQEFDISNYLHTAIRANLEPYVYERYLKLYHLLELSFDYDLVKEIKKLNTDLKGIGSIFGQYAHNDETRLRDLFKKYCKTVDLLSKHKSALKVHQAIAIKILFDYGKKCPIEKELFNEYLAEAKSLNEKQALPFLVYLVYRIRCCVAHHKIGEYLIDDSDMDFLLDFAEPLLRDILCEVFSPSTS